MRKQQQLPSPEAEKFDRWTTQRKAAIILEVLKGQISVPEAARKYEFAQGEYRKWADEFMRGVDALKVNHRGLDAEHRTEVRRLQEKDRSARDGERDRQRGLADNLFGRKRTAFD